MRYGHLPMPIDDLIGEGVPRCPCHGISRHLCGPFRLALLIYTRVPTLPAAFHTAAEWGLKCQKPYCPDCSSCHSDEVNSSEDEDEGSDGENDRQRSEPMQDDDEWVPPPPPNTRGIRRGRTLDVGHSHSSKLIVLMAVLQDNDNSRRTRRREVSGILNCRCKLE